jgi:hypothetical protein
VAAAETSSRNGWLIAGGVVATTAGYGLWEWRSEVAGGFRRFKQLFGNSPLSD